MANHSIVVLKSPHITEKGTHIQVNRQYLFKVHSDANKAQIKSAIESEFKVKVAAVNTVNMEGKVRRYGRTTGKRQDWKKAYVTLVEGYTINLSTPDAGKE